MPDKANAVILSIHPKWWHLIRLGEKTVELRKTAPKITSDFKVLVYVTQPVGKIVGEFNCPAIEEVTISNRSCSENDAALVDTCLTEQDALDYLRLPREIGIGGSLPRSRKCFRWPIRDLKIYSAPHRLHDYTDHIPQSWEYYRRDKK